MTSGRAASSTLRQKGNVSLTSLCSSPPASSDLLFPALLQHLRVAREDDEKPLTRDEVVESKHRWRSAFVVWRKVLDCDVFFLGMLLHSGCVWSPKFDYLYRVFHYRMYQIVAALREDNEEDLTHDSGLAHLPSLCSKVLNSMQEDYPFDVFALLILHFLCIVEVFSLPSSTNSLFASPYDTALPLDAPSSAMKAGDRQEGAASLFPLSPSTGCSFTVGAEDQEEDGESFHSSEDFFFPACLKVASSAWSATFSSSSESASANRAPKPVCSSSLSWLSRSSSPCAAASAQRNERREDKRGYTTSPGGTSQNGGDSENSSISAEIGYHWNRDRMRHCKKGEGARHGASNGSAPPSASRWTTTASDADVMEVQAVAHQLVDDWFRLMDHPYLYGGVKCEGSPYRSGSEAERRTTVCRATSEEARGLQENASVGSKSEDEAKSHFCSSSFPSLCGNGYAMQLKQRDLWFASAIKFSSHVTSEGGRSALLERNVHLMAILSWQRKGWSSYRTLLQDSLPAIFLCLLEQETCLEENEVTSCGTPLGENIQSPKTEGKEEDEYWVGTEMTAPTKTCQEKEDSTGRVEKKHMATARDGFKVLCFPPLPLLLPFHLFGKGSTIAVPHSSLESSLSPHELEGVLQTRECCLGEGGRTEVRNDSERNGPLSGAWVESQSAANEKITIGKQFGRWKRQIFSIPHRKAVSSHCSYNARMKSESKQRKSATSVNSGENTFLLGSSRTYSLGSSRSLSSSLAFLSSLLALSTKSEMEMEEDKKREVAAAHQAVHKLWLRQNQIRSHGVVVFHSIPIEERHLFFHTRAEEEEKKCVFPSPCLSSSTLSPSIPLSSLSSIASKEGVTKSPMLESCTSLFLKVEEKTKDNVECEENQDKVQWEEADAQEASVGIGIALRCRCSPVRCLPSYSFRNRSEVLSHSAMHMQPAAKRQRCDVPPYQFPDCKEEEPYRQESEAKKRSGEVSGDTGNSDSMTVRCSLFTLGMIKIESSRVHGRRSRASFGSFSHRLAVNSSELRETRKSLEVEAYTQRKEKRMEMQMEEGADRNASGKEQRRKRRRVSMIRNYGFKKKGTDSHYIEVNEEQEEMEKEKEETFNKKKRHVQSGKKTAKEQKIERESGLSPHVWLMKCSTSPGNTEKKPFSSSFPLSFPSTSIPFSYWLLYGTPNSGCGSDDCQDSFSSCAGGAASSCLPLAVRKSRSWKSNAPPRYGKSGRSPHFCSCVSRVIAAVKWFESFYGEKVEYVPFLKEMGSMNGYGWVVQCEVNEPKVNSAYERGKRSGGDVLEERNEEEQQHQHTLMLDPLFHFLRALFCTARRALSLRGTALRSSSTSSPVSSLSSLLSFSWHSFRSPETELIALVHLSHSFALLTLLLATTSRFFRCDAVEMEEETDSEGMRTENTGHLSLPAFIQLWFSEVVSFLADTSLLLASSSSLSAFSTTLSTEVKGERSPNLSFSAPPTPSPLSTCSFVNANNWRKTFPIFLLLRNVCWALALHPVASESVLVAVGWVARMVQFDGKWMKNIRDEVVCSLNHYCRSSSRSLEVSDLYSAVPLQSSASPAPLLRCFISFINVILGDSHKMPDGDGEYHGKESMNEKDEGKGERRRFGNEWLSACMPQGWWILWYKAQSEMVKVLRPWLVAAPCSSVEEENEWLPSDVFLSKSTKKRIASVVDVDEEEAQQRLVMVRKLPLPSSSFAACGDGGVKEDGGVHHVDVTAVKTSAVVPKRWSPTAVDKDRGAAQLFEKECNTSTNDKDVSSMTVVGIMRRRREEESESLLPHHLFFTPYWQKKTSFGVKASLLPLIGISKERRIAVLEDASDKSSLSLTSDEISKDCRENSGSAAYYMFGDAVCNHIDLPPSFTFS